MSSPDSFYRRPLKINGKFLPVSIILRADIESKAEFISASSPQSFLVVRILALKNYLPEKRS